MIPYNTDLEKLVLPEYGRLVYEMVKACKEVEDREQRNIIASAIVETMKSMTADKQRQPDDRKYWDHLFIISGHTLDVDSPYGVPTDSELHPVARKIPYSTTEFGRRHYGHIIQRMVKQVAKMPNSEEKDACVELLTNHIKKLLVVNNDENTTDGRVYGDLYSMSGGSIAVEEGIFDLPEYKEEKPAKAQKRKKGH